MNEQRVLEAHASLPELDSGDPWAEDSDAVDLGRIDLDQRTPGQRRYARPRKVDSVVAGERRRRRGRLRQRPRKVQPRNVAAAASRVATERIQVDRSVE